ncbi:MAG: preprotein translocase subunit SecE [bacterium]|nr:preprotein translocase subunit SecE [bacterium]
MANLATYLKESRHEMGKVIWPNKHQLIVNSVLVVGVSLGIAAFIGVADYVFTELFALYLRLR